jgi:3-deoxy-manno-octulosonate cytidylyltransferase (CMP-KDO synthetase)
MKSIGIIPARYASTRFPGKPLIDLAGKTMIQRVYERAAAAPTLDAVVVATDDQRIYDHVLSFGGQVKMTRPEHQTGTDRCAEVSQHFPDYDLVLNIQGDEPFLSYEQMELVLAPLRAGEAEIATLALAVGSLEELLNPNIVKLAIDQKNRALYFSRSVIPHLRNAPQEKWLDTAVFYRHIGLYGFVRDTLLQITQLPMGRLEQLEMLEQLRWLENGRSIAVRYTDRPIVGIDTPEDLEKALAYIRKQEGE